MLRKLLLMYLSGEFDIEKGSSSNWFSFLHCFLLLFLVLWHLKAPVTGSRVEGLSTLWEDWVLYSLCDHLFSPNFQDFRYWGNESACSAGFGWNQTSSSEVTDREARQCSVVVEALCVSFSSVRLPCIWVSWLLPTYRRAGWKEYASSFHLSGCWKPCSWSWPDLLLFILPTQPSAK